MHQNDCPSFNLKKQSDSSSSSSVSDQCLGIPDDITVMLLPELMKASSKSIQKDSNGQVKMDSHSDATVKQNDSTQQQISNDSTQQQVSNDSATKRTHSQFIKQESPSKGSHSVSSSSAATSANASNKNAKFRPNETKSTSSASGKKPTQGSLFSFFSPAVPKTNTDTTSSNQ